MTKAGRNFFHYPVSNEPDNGKSRNSPGFNPSIFRHSVICNWCTVLACCTSYPEAWNNNKKEDFCTYHNEKGKTKRKRREVNNNAAFVEGRKGGGLEPFLTTAKLAWAPSLSLFSPCPTAHQESRTNKSEGQGGCLGSTIKVKLGSLHSTLMFGGGGVIILGGEGISPLPHS
jgi:hypothetical protein